MTLGGGEWVGGGVAIMMLHVWQNDTFPKFGISFLSSYPFCFALEFSPLEVKAIHHSQQNAIKQTKLSSIIIALDIGTPPFI